MQGHARGGVRRLELFDARGVAPGLLDQCALALVERAVEVEQVFVLTECLGEEVARVAGEDDEAPRLRVAPGDARDEAAAEAVAEDEYTLRVNARRAAEQLGRRERVVHRLLLDRERPLRRGNAPAVDARPLVVAQHRDAA